MGHQKYKKCLEEYVAGTLPPGLRGETDQHLSSCPQCQKQLRLIRLTSGITKASFADGEEPLPSPWFAQKVLRSIEQQEKQSLALWNPLAWIAARAIPLIATLAILLGIIAYSEIGALSQLSAENPLLSSFNEPSANWSNEVLATDTSVQSAQRIHDAASKTGPAKSAGKEESRP
jgi:anti-sigma factor RsiW